MGHSFIKAQMAEHDAVFGGEHSAHYYFRDFFFADTGMLAAMHVLAALGGQSGTLSALSEAYQPYSASGEINSRVEDVPAARARVVQAYVTDEGAGPVDGRRARRPDRSATGTASPRWWFNLRASNTEPLLRLNVEAADEDVMEKVRDDVLALVRQDTPPVAAAGVTGATGVSGADTAARAGRDASPDAARRSSPGCGTSCAAR